MTPKMVIRQESHQLYVPLTQDELIRKAEEAANKSVERMLLEDEFGRVKKDYQARLEAKENEIHCDLECVRTRKQMREVNCDAHYIPQERMVEYRYNGEVLKSRPMTEHEFDLVTKNTTFDNPHELLPQNVTHKPKGKQPLMGHYQTEDDGKSADIQSVMRSETNAKTKKDLVQ